MDLSSFVTLIGILTVFLTNILTLLAQRRTANDIQKIELSLNSRLTQLLEVTKKLSHSEGKAEGVAERTL